MPPQQECDVHHSPLTLPICFGLCELHTRFVLFLIYMLVSSSGLRLLKHCCLTFLFDYARTMLLGRHNQHGGNWAVDLTDFGDLVQAGN